MNNGCKDDGGDGKDSNDADIIILEDLTHSAERLHLSSPKKKLNDAREKAAYFEKEVLYILVLIQVFDVLGVLIDVYVVQYDGDNNIVLFAP